MSFFPFQVTKVTTVWVSSPRLLRSVGEGPWGIISYEKKINKITKKKCQMDVVSLYGELCLIKFSIKPFDKFDSLMSPEYVHIKVIQLPPCDQNGQIVPQ